MAGRARIARGRVAGVKRAWLTGGYRLHYRYHDMFGREHVGAWVLNQRDAFVWREGDEGDVRYDTHDPARSAWVGTGRTRGAESRAADVISGTLEIPSTLRLARRAPGIKRAGLHAVYLVSASFFWALALAEFMTPENRRSILLYGLVPATFAFLFVRSAARGVDMVRQWRRIGRTGLSVDGTITAVDDQEVSWGRRTWKPGWVISYRYVDAGGRTRAGESGYLSRREAAAWRKDDRCRVMYDAAYPERSLWIGR